jgi:predicted GIY-YIG superfamily endonuclease
MFSVYKITNTINGRCYIGSSIHPEKRWRQHKNSAFNPHSPGYNYPLY